MKFAFSNAGYWFFFLFMIFATLSGVVTVKESEELFWRVLCYSAGIAFLIAATRFFLLWHRFEEFKFNREYGDPKKKEEQ